MDRKSTYRTFADEAGRISRGEHETTVALPFPTASPGVDVDAAPTVVLVGMGAGGPIHIWGFNDAQQN